MKDRKRILNLHNPCDWKAVERDLTRKAAGGWQLEYTGKYFWHYRRAEPAAIHYAVTYLPSLDAYEPRPSADERDLDSICAAAGWQKVCGWGNMLIYKNEQPDPVPLITDERLRLDNIHAAMKKGSLLLMGIVFGGSAVLSLLFWPMWALLTAVNPQFMLLMGICCLGVPGAWLLNYRVWYQTARRAVAENQPCPVNRSAGWLDIVWLLFALCLLGTNLYHNWFADPPQFWYALLYLAGLLALGALGEGLRRLLRDNGSSKAANIAITLVILIACAAVLVLGLQVLFG